MPNRKNKPFLLNQTQAAEFLGVDRRMIIKKQLPTINRGRAVLYDSQDLLAWAIDRATAKLKKQIASMSGEKTLTQNG